MTERPATEQFKVRFKSRVRAYTDVATSRRIDALAVSRIAMSAPRATGSSAGGLVAGLLGRRSLGLRWAAVGVAVILLGAIGIGVAGRTSISPTPSRPAPGVGPVPDVLRHSWQRPQAVLPGLDKWGSGFLSLTDRQLDLRTAPGDAASRSEVIALGPDTIVVTATAETRGCSMGDSAAYHWSVEGKDTVMTLTAIAADACPAREGALAGRWVRSDFPPNEAGTVPAGTYLTSTFDPLGDPTAPMRLRYTVPAGWDVIEEDGSVTFVRRQAPGASPGELSSDSIVVVMADPRMTPDTRPGATCGPEDGAPGAGGSLDALMTAIIGRSGVVSDPPSAVTIGGRDGRLLDLRLAPSWTGGCISQDVQIAGVTILRVGGSVAGPIVGLAKDQPLRLILVRLTDERTLAIALFDIGPSRPSTFEAHLAMLMPIVHSFEFHAPAP